MIKLKRKVAGIMAAISAMTALAISSSAVEIYNNPGSYTASPDTSTYLHQSFQNPHNSSTNYVLNSSYERVGNKYTIQAIYGAQPFTTNGVGYYYRYAIVRAYDQNGNIAAASNPAISTESDVTAFAQKSNVSYTSNLDYVEFKGECRVNPTQSSTGYLQIRCNLNFQ